MDVTLDLVHKREGTVLGDLKTSKIVILNDDDFPMDKNPELFDEFGREKFRKRDVIWGFIIHNYHALKNDVHWAFLYRLAPGVCFVIGQTITKMLLKSVSIGYAKQDQGLDKKEWYGEFVGYLVICAAGYVLNFFIAWYTDLCFMRLKLGGKATRSLRTAAMDIITQLTPEYEEQFDTGRVMKIADVQIDLAVHTTWLACFNLYGNLFKIIAMIAFVFYSAIAVSYPNFPEEEDKEPNLMFLVVIPFGMIIMDMLWLYLKIVPASEKNHAAMEADDKWSSFMVQASFLRHIITTYRKGFNISKDFEKIHKDYNDVAFDAAYFAKNTQYMANFFPTFTAALVMVFAGFEVMEGKIPVSTFVVFTNTVNSFGGVLAGVFMDLFNIGKGYASIRKLAALLNSQTRRKELLQGKERREKLVAKYIKERVGPFDPDGIVIHNLSYDYIEGNEKERLVMPSCYADGGQLLKVSNGGVVGRKTFLRLMARHYIPKEGFIHYPPRWRVRFMSATPLFFGGDIHSFKMAEKSSKEAFDKEKKRNVGTLEFNLKFGANFQRPVDEEEGVWDSEIWALCNRLGVSARLIGKSEQEFILEKKYTMVGLNGEKLSITDQVLLSLARALLSSVDLLLISNMLDLLEDERALHVLSILDEWRMNRCVHELKTENNSMKPSLRKKKTLILSSKVRPHNVIIYKKNHAIKFIFLFSLSA